MDSHTNARDSDSREWIHLLDSVRLIHLLQNEILIEMHNCTCEWIHLLQN